MNAPAARPLLSTTQALPVIADELPVPRLRRLMLKALGLPIAVMLLLCGLLALKVGAEAAGGAEIRHARAVIDEAHRTERLIVAQESALRGYVIAQEDMLLTPLLVGHTRVPEALERLDALVADHPAQRDRVAALTTSYGRWSAAAGLEGAAPVRPAAAARQQLTRRAELLDGVGQQVRAIVDFERQRQQQAEAAGQWFGAPMALAAALALALIAATAVVLRRWIRRMEGIYAKALALRRHSEAGERAARQAAEALAAEVTVQSRELQLRFRAMRDELTATRSISRAI